MLLHPVVYYVDLSNLYTIETRNFQRHKDFMYIYVSKACKKISTLNEPTSVKTFPMHRNAQFEKEKKLNHVKW